MAIDTSYFAKDLAGVIADLPTAVKYGTAEFNASASQLSQDQILLLTGNQNKIGVLIVFPASSITGQVVPKEQGRVDLKFPDPATYTHYQIALVELSPDTLSYNLTLMQDNRN